MSTSDKLRKLKLNEYTYIESESAKQAQNLRRRLSITDRLPKDLQTAKFKCEARTAIDLLTGEVGYLLKVTKIK